MSNDIYHILKTFDSLTEGLNAQQQSVKQLPALFKPKNISPVLGSEKDPESPMKGYFVGGESTEGPVVNRGGNNPLRDKEDYLDKRDHLYQLLSAAGMSAEDKEVVRDRLGQLEQAARLKGIAEELGDASSHDAVSGAILRRIGSQHLELLSQYGPEAVMNAVDEVADFVGDVEEIGTSDVSGWVRQVETALQSGKLDEVSLGDYHRKATLSKAMAQMNKGFGYPGDHDTTIAAREKGLARAKERGDKWQAAHDEKTRADALARDRANRHNIEAELIDLKTKFDPDYEYSDDYSEWSKQRDIKNQIASLERRLKELDESLTEAVASEDIISNVKKKLGDYLSDVATAIKKDPDLVDKLPGSVDQMKSVKTITTDDGHEIKIHGNEDDGFRVTIKNKQSNSKFGSLDEAVMACEMFCARRKQADLNADYMEER